MKLTITHDKKIHFATLGNTEEQKWTNRQEEELEVEVLNASQARRVIDVGTLKVFLKETRDSDDIIAECNDFTASSNLHTGWINLGTDEAIAAGNKRLYIEAYYEIDGHAQRTDEAFVYLVQSVGTGDEGSPVTTSALVTAEWLADHILASASFTLTPDTEAGTITLAPVFATQAEAEAGTATTPLMNPLRVAQAIAELAGGGSGAWDDITDKPSNLCLVTNSSDGLFVEFRDLSGTLITKVLRVAE